MEELFHKRSQNIIKNKDNRSKIYKFLKKEFINSNSSKEEQYKQMKWQMRICSAYYRIYRNKVWLKIYSGLFKIK